LELALKRTGHFPRASFLLARTITTQALADRRQKALIDAKSKLEDYLTTRDENPERNAKAAEMLSQGTTILLCAP